MRENPVQLPAHLGHSRVERKPVEELNPAPYNPRKELRPGDPEYAKLHRSIEQFGYVDPLVWNERTGNLVGGHQRLNILRREYRVKEIDVVVVDVDPAHEKALNVALNKIEGSWDEEQLTKVLSELEVSDAIDVELTGFDLQEIERDFNLAVDGLDRHDEQERPSAAGGSATGEKGPGDGEGDGDGDGDGESDEGRSRLGNLEYRVIIDCDGEEHQRETLEELERQGYRCRALIS